MKIKRGGAGTERDPLTCHLSAERWLNVGDRESETASDPGSKNTGDRYFDRVNRILWVV